jgi:hypothetical protein
MSMQKLYINSGPNTPEIHFSPDENIFLISGRSAPEDVRAIYYPVIREINTFVSDIIAGKYSLYTPENPLIFKVDLTYFNSSSTKFLYDIFSELKRLPPFGIQVIVKWFYDDEDLDMKEAGADIALLVGMEFTYIPKKS